jgi:pimeloyl-ACP methyl ester carboxylesterase
MKLDIGGFEAYAYTGGKPFDPALPCVVFIHGALNDHSVWTLLARSLAHHGYSVLAVDLPGHGRSGGLPLADVEALAGWIWALLDAAGVRRAALVGHSMGSLIALEAAGQQPARASNLVMVATAYPMKVSDALLTTAREAPLAAIDMVNNFSHSTWAAKPSFPGPGAWLHGGARALMRRMQSRQTEVNLFAHDFGVCDAYAGGMEAAAKVTCPASLILGARDQMTVPKLSAGLATALQAQVITVPAGHALMAEAPDQALAALRQALAPQLR